jgi:hypothetical protein
MGRLSFIFIIFFGLTKTSQTNLASLLAVLYREELRLTQEGFPITLHGAHPSTPTTILSRIHVTTTSAAVL